MEEPKANGTLNKINTKSEELNETIKSLLIYVGFVGAVVSGFAYIIITIVMVTGFKSNFSAQQQIIFSLLGAVVGIMMMSLLRSQGIAFAKRNKESQRIMKEYQQALNKNKQAKQLHDINWYIIKSIIIDLIVKGSTFAATTYFALYIAMEGNGDWALIGLAIANVLFFLSLGLIALSKTYDFYLEEHLKVIEERTKRIVKSNLKKNPPKNKTTKKTSANKTKK